MYKYYRLKKSTDEYFNFLKATYFRKQRNKPTIMVKVKPDEDSASGHSNSTIGGSTSFNLEGLTGKDGRLLYRVKHCFRQILCIITIEN